MSSTILSIVANNKIRIIVDYGDIKTGKSWNEEFDVCGYVGRSSGMFKIPILLYNKRSLSGCAIMDSCIIKITTSAGKRVLYQHKEYNK